MIHPSMKSPLILSIGGVGLVAGSIIALSYWNHHRQPSEMEAATIPQPSLTAPDVFIPTSTDPWERGQEFGWEAAVAAQTASSEADWRRVGDLWLQAIAELEQVSPDSPQRQEAQAKIQTYLANFEYAEGEKAKARATKPAAPSQISMATLKATLAEGPMKIQFAAETTDDGNPAMVGQTPDGRARIELAGAGDNLNQANLILSGHPESSPLTMANVVYINHLLSATLPDGMGQRTWAADSLSKLESQPDQPLSQNFGPVQVNVSTHTSAGGIVVTITPKP